MPCTTIHTPDGTVLACSRTGRRPRPCAVCGRPARYLCDFVVTRVVEGHVCTTTCDKPLCGEHARRRPGGKDWCLGHPLPGAAASQARESVGE